MNNQTSLSEIGYVAYRHEKKWDDAIIICPKNIPYEKRMENISQEIQITGNENWKEEFFKFIEEKIK